LHFSFQKRKKREQFSLGFFLSPQCKKFSPPPPPPKKRKNTSPKLQKPPQNLKMVSTCDKIISKKFFFQEFGKFFPCLEKQGIW